MRKSELLFLSVSLYFFYLLIYLCDLLFGLFINPVSLAPQAGKLPALREMLGCGFGGDSE